MTNPISTRLGMNRRTGTGDTAWEDRPVTEAKDERIRTTSGSRARDHLANERTWLAWVRTAVGLVVLGAAVARFSPDQGARNDAAAALIVAIGLAALFIRDLPLSGDEPRTRGGLLPYRQPRSHHRHPSCAAVLRAPGRIGAGPVEGCSRATASVQRRGSRSPRIPLCLVCRNLLSCRTPLGRTVKAPQRDFVNATSGWAPRERRRTECPPRSWPEPRVFRSEPIR